MRRSNHLPNQQNASFFQPCIVGYMSVDESRNYCPDISQLKFVNIPRGEVSLDLNHNIDLAVKRSRDHDDKLDLLLKFLLHEGNRFKFPPNTFISYRSTLLRVMCRAINIIEPTCIRACKFKNNIYMRHVDSEREKHRKATRSEFERKSCFWGYKFEHYLLSDEPNIAPDINKPVVENEECVFMYCSQIGDRKLFYGAQADGLLASTNTAPKPNTTDVKEIVQYLRNNEYLEFKTSKEIVTPNQDRNFRKHTLLRCWCQCYLANYKGLLVGFRDDNGVVHRLQWFDTAEIPEYCKNEWDVQTTLNFLNHFLNTVENYFDAHDNEIESSVPFTVDFQMDLNRNINPVVNQNDSLLPDWYIEALK